ncbi:MAG: hypothetical protein D6798_11285 [Deltaproteobacteria bacterium]|nr:MAG: hypothetical protein D6798_11285 [Deltaproteobacteria bacterium]
MAELFEAWGRGLVRHRHAALALSLLITLAAVAAIGTRVRHELPIDFTPQAIFMDGGRDMQRLREIEADYGRDDNDIVLLVEGALATPEGVEALRRLHAACEALPEIERVDSLVNATLVGNEGGTLRIIHPLDRWPPAEALAHAAADPILRRLVVSEDGKLAAIAVRIDRRRSQVRELAEVVDRVQDAIASVDLPAGMQVRMTGVPYIRAEVVAMMTADEARFLPLVAGIFAITTWLLFGRFWSGIAPLVVALVGNVWAMGVLLGTGAVLNILSVLVPTLVVVIGVSDGVHLVARYREELDPPDGAPVDPATAMGRTLRHLGGATFLTTFTTAAGFASLLVARTRVVREFGWQCAVAVAISWLAVMLVLPAWLSFVPRHRVGGRLQADRGQALFTALDVLVRRHARAIIAGSLLLLLGAGLVGSRVRTQSHILEIYPPDHPTARTVHLVETRLAGIVPVMVQVEAPVTGDDDARDALLVPELLAPMAALQDEVLQEPLVRWASSPAGWVRHLHALLTGESVVPPSRQAIAQELLLAEMSGDLPLDTVLSSDGNRGRILMLTVDGGGRDLIALRDRIRDRAEALFAGTGARVEVTGDGFVASSGIRGLVGDLLGSVGLVLVVIVLTLQVLLRDLRLALISTVPNVAPLVITLATLGMMGADIMVSNIVSFTVAIGLAVDDTIHFVVRYREELARGRTPPEAISASFHGAGRGIVLTSLLLVAGFGVLVLSDLTSTRFFGILAAVTLGAALFADLLLLPALLHVAGRRVQGSPIPPGTT